jgi:hypothetical protein
LTDPAARAILPDLACVVQFEALTRPVVIVHPHSLRHGRASYVWKTATPTAMMEILGQRRIATTLTEGNQLRTICADRAIKDLSYSCRLNGRITPILNTATRVLKHHKAIIFTAIQSTAIRKGPCGSVCCHDRKTALDTLQRLGGTDDNSQSTEEPGEGATFTPGSEDESAR